MMRQSLLIENNPTEVYFLQFLSVPGRVLACFSSLFWLSGPQIYWLDLVWLFLPNSVPAAAVRCFLQRMNFCSDKSSVHNLTSTKLQTNKGSDTTVWYLAATIFSSGAGGDRNKAERRVKIKSDSSGGWTHNSKWKLTLFSGCVTTAACSPQLHTIIPSQYCLCRLLRCFQVATKSINTAFSQQ